MKFLPTLIGVLLLLSLNFGTIYCSVEGYTLCLGSFYNVTTESGNDDFCDDVYDTYTDVRIVISLTPL